MTTGVRLFVGVDVSIDCANELGETAAALRGKAAELDFGKMSWVAPARYHVTLKFLGWAKPEAVFAIRDRIAPVAAEVRGFSFGISELGAFPKIESARVLWAGVKPSDELATLAREIDRATAEIGFEAEKHEFHPHVTLARLRKVANISEVLVGSERQYSKTRCQSINLYQSDMKSTASGYPVCLSWPLARGRKSKTSEGGSRTG